MNGFWITFKREWKRLISDPHYAFCIFLAPAICIAFFTTLMKDGLPTKLPIGLVDEDNTTVTRQLARNLDAFQQTDIKAAYPTPTKAREAMQRGEIYGFYYIPKGTTANVNSQKLPMVSFYSNFTYIVAGSLLSRDMRMMSELSSAAAGRKILLARGKSDRAALAYLQPIVIDAHPIHNPWLNYNIYISNTVLPGIMGIFILMVTVYGLGLEIKQGTAQEYLSGSGGNILLALYGKLLPQTLMFFTMGIIYDIIMYGILDFPCYNGIGSMIFIMLCFILSCQGLGVVFITLLPTLRLGMSAASLWGVISFSISGMSFPVMAMSAPLQGLSFLFPLRHYFLLYVNCALDGYPLSNSMSNIAFLLGFGLLPLICAKRLKHNLLTVKYVP